MKIATLITKGPLPYKHVYMQTNTSYEVCDHMLDVPKHLKTLASKDASVCRFGDNSLGIEIDGNVFAIETPHRESRQGKKLPYEVWQYLKLAMGEVADTYAN